MFAMQLTKADSPYFIENSKLKQQFANDPDAYADAQEKLKADFVRKDMPKLTYLTSDALLRNPSSVATSRPSGSGRGAKTPKVVYGNAAPTVLKGYGKPSKNGELNQELISYPLMASDAVEEQAPIFEKAKSIPAINIGENQVIKKQPIPPQSDFDIANPKYTVLPILIADIKVNFKNKAGDIVKTKTYKKGTVIGQGDEFSGENKDMIALVAKEANKNNNIKYEFGALIPTYARQSKPRTYKQVLEEARLTDTPVEEVQAKYESKKQETYQGLNFFPRDMTKSSVFQKAWAAGQKLYRGKTLEQIERELKKKGPEMLNNELGLSPFAGTQFFQKPVAPAPVTKKSEADL
jgi:hypothetical protein